MKGHINNIFTNRNGNKYGYITGDDGNSYYFDSRFLLGTTLIENIKINDCVQFINVPPQYGKYNGTAKNVMLIDITTSTKQLDILSKSKNDAEISSDIEQKQDIEESSDLEISSGPVIGKEIIKFFKKGFAHHMDKNLAYRQHFKKGSGEDIVIDKLSQILYISRINHHIIDQSSNYPFCLFGATELLSFTW